MGMHDKDKEIGLILQQYVPKREEFILWDASIVRDDFPTDIGPATQVELWISLGTDDTRGQHKVRVTTLAAPIAAKVREAEPDDFPAVMFWSTVQSKFNNDATVITYVRDLHQSRETSPAAPGEGAPKK
jgi:hypothetical protein